MITGTLAAIQAISADATKLATDQAAVNTAQTALATAQAVVASDSTQTTADDAALAALLAGTPGVFQLNSDGTATFYEPSATLPGFTIITAPPAS
jgi:inosine/xanthosine triphosphate pyrophosphatase family protein